MAENKHHEYLDDMPLAICYVPWQQMTSIYEDLEMAFRCGTIFPELAKPFTGRRCLP